jgi:hypothetical protein
MVGAIPGSSWLDTIADYSEPLHTVAIIRQDVPAKKLYVYDIYLEQEALLYDLDLTVGIYPPLSPIPFIRVSKWSYR